MTDTLRSIVEGMEHESNMMDYHAPRACLSTCRKCRVEALLTEYEKVELVKKWREDAKPFLDYHGIGSVILKCADELETWLAVNLERIKAQARMEEAKWWWGMYTEGAPAVCDKRIVALEAQAKEKP